MRETRERESMTLADPIAPLRVALLGRYEIGRQIGQGAYATVYLARDLKHERQVALKVLNADPTSETGEIRFVREIRTLARLQHPNILPLYDSGHVEAFLYYVMPYLKGETLRDRMHREKQLSVHDACGIGREIADALSYAHAQGVVHRDIKPENILLSAAHPIIADFGIARVIDITGVRQLTQTGMGSPGTPAYMSPEQLMGERQMDGRSDIYSLGCVLYEMLTGKPPFAGKEGFAKRFTERPPSISLTRHGTPPWLDKAIGRALERAPRDRYATAEEFVGALCPPEEEVTKTEIVPLPAQSSLEASSLHTADAVPWAPSHIYEGPSAARSSFPRSRPLLVSAAAALAALALFGVLARRNGVARLGGVPPIDSSRVVILPFRGERNAAAQVRRNFEDVWSDWQDLHLASDIEVAELLPKEGLPRSLSEARAIGEKLGARRLVWGEVYGGAQTPHAKGELYDLADNTQSSPRTVVLDGPITDRNSFVKASFALLKNPERPAMADGGDGGTHSLAAWSAYGNAHVALANWDLGEAERSFTEATQADPTFYAAQAWLAQLVEWRRYDGGEWQPHANRAMEGVAHLSSRDSLIASAVGAIASGDFPAACTSYRALSKIEAVNFMGWYGLGECQRLDKTVVRDRSSESGWRFRASLHNSRTMYMRALRLEPRAHALLTFDKVEELLPTSASSSRIGKGSDSTSFAAFPSLAGDTLAEIPYPLARFATLSASATLSHSAALDRNSTLLLTFASDWAEQFPQSPDAYEALADILDVRGEASDTRAGQVSAVGAARQALKLTTSPQQRLRLSAREARLWFKGSEFQKAGTLADSLLRNHPAATSDEALELIGLAAMTGRIRQTAQLARLGGQPQFPMSVAIAAPVAEAAANFFARAALGACGDATLSSERQLDNALQSYVPENKRDEIRAVLATRAFSLLTPCTQGKSSLRIVSPQDRLYRMQQAFARGDFPSVRATIDTLSDMRRASRPGDLTLDYTYQEAWLKTAMGDTVGAIQQLDLALGALPTLSGLALREVGAAAAVGRAIALRAELAESQHDVRAAKKWAAALVALWSGADAELQPTVSQMKELAGLKK
jgi:eukaryotic-like serine/threonine-protein kinase